nr:hypothetical protein [Fodinicola feengrottensis]
MPRFASFSWALLPFHRDRSARLGSSRSTLISEAGISSRNREGGLYCGWPHAVRVKARDR